MKKIIMSIKIFPSDNDVSLDKILEEIRKNFPTEEILYSSREPVAFGVDALLIDITAPEEEGISQAFEERIKAISGVGEVYIEGVRRFVDVKKPS